MSRLSDRSASTRQCGALDRVRTLESPRAHVPGLQRSKKSRYFDGTAHTAFGANLTASLTWLGGSSVSVYSHINFPTCANVIYSVRRALEVALTPQLDGVETLAIQCRGTEELFRQRVFVGSLCVARV